MEILLVSALSLEIRPLLGALRLRGLLVSGHGPSKRIVYGRMRITTWTLGMGADRSSEILQEVLSRCEPQLVLLAGFSGAVHPTQKVGDIALPTIFTDMVKQKECRGFEISGVRQGLEHGLRRKGIRLLNERRAVTVRSLIGPHEKSQVGKLWPNACGVDMESYPLAQFCSGRKISFLCVRAIFDEDAQKLPSLRSAWRDIWGLPQWYLRYRRAAWSLSEAVQCVLDLQGSLIAIR